MHTIVFKCSIIVCILNIAKKLIFRIKSYKEKYTLALTLHGNILHADTLIELLIEIYSTVIAKLLLAHMK